MKTKNPIKFSHPGYVWYIEVLVMGEWKRMSKPYAVRSTASGWVSFVKKYWYAEAGRTVKVKWESEASK